MEREEKGAAEKQEFWGIKLKRGILVGKRGGSSTPVLTWRTLGDAQDSTFQEFLSIPPSVSARKLAANLWEIQHHLPLAKMSKGGVRLRHHHKDKLLELPSHLADPSHSPPDQVEEEPISPVLVFWDV
ncbi:hypothetical protein HHK36_029085 [Tetracentron sinense]|uniref:Uncharacterized protein n=1 Tax=Tetracentron sinense TaxID=13715 RepID=A0A835D0U2_TETSI|nr:hypothetical protein HHK36_029085 [Tetracentron sinense]